MRNAGIRHAGDQIRLNRTLVALCQHRAAVVAHLLDIDTLIRGGRISVVDPQERADLHILARFSDGLHTVRRHMHDLRRSQLLVIRVAEIEVGEILKRDAVAVLALADDHRCASQTVARRIDAVLCHEQQRHRAVDDALNIADALDNAVLFADQRRNQLGRVDLSAGHLLEMSRTVLIDLADQFLEIVDLSHRRDGKAAEVGLDQQRLRFIIRNAGNTQIALHAACVPLELGAERRVFDIVDRTVKSTGAVYRHAAAACAEVRVVVHAIKQIEYTVVFRCYAKKSAHSSSPI